ncbi:uncharacterized protein LOC106998107 isoform X2 [Macaca mulatta]
MSEVEFLQESHLDQGKLEIPMRYLVGLTQGMLWKRIRRPERLCLQILNPSRHTSWLFCRQLPRCPGGPPRPHVAPAHAQLCLTKSAQEERRGDCVVHPESQAQAPSSGHQLLSQRSVHLSTGGFCVSAERPPVHGVHGLILCLSGASTCPLADSARQLRWLSLDGRLQDHH